MKFEKKIAKGARTHIVSVASVLAMVLTTGASAQTASPVIPDAQPPTTTADKPAKFRWAPPKGFDDLGGPVETVFDLYYQDHRVGTFSGRLENGTFVFLKPDQVVPEVPGVAKDKLLDLLSKPLPANEDLKCLPGITSDCGVLKVGESGVIVDQDRFRIDLFLSRDYYTAPISPKYLGPPVSGFSVIQNITGALAINGNNSTPQLGFGLNTLASFGRTSFVSNAYGGTDQGVRLDDFYVQNYQNTRRYALGLLQSQSSLTLNSFRLYGAEISSFDGALSHADDSATPLDVVLPRPGRVEIYRNGILVSTDQYEGGLQLLDTSRLPVGSYQVRIVARDSSGVVLDETRNFTRAPDLPPPGHTIYAVRAGVRADDNFSNLTGITEDMPLFPKSSGESVLNASASHRIGKNNSITAGITAIGNEVYPELGFQTYHGLFRGVAGVTFGSDNQYATLVSSNFQFHQLSGDLTLRSVKASDDLISLNGSKYTPFLQTEDSLSGGVQAPLFNGSFTMRAGYSRSRAFPARHSLSLGYARPVTLSRLGASYLNFELVTSETETRVGMRLAFSQRIDAQSSFNGMLGGDYLNSSESDSHSLYPNAQIGYSRQSHIGQTDLALSANAGTAAGASSAEVAGSATSGLGEADLTIGATQQHDSKRTDTYLNGNFSTGFIYGDGIFHAGARGQGDAAVLVDVQNVGSTVSDGSRFNVRVDDIKYDTLTTNQRSAIIMPAFENVKVALEPESAPPFSLDLTPRQVPLYPGNVVHLTWKATRVVTAYGRLIDLNGTPVGQARVEGGDDVIMSSDDGYFAITAPEHSDIKATLQDNQDCGTVSVMPESKSLKAIVRLGDIRCAIDTRLLLKTAVTEPITQPGVAAVSVTPPNQGAVATAPKPVASRPPTPAPAKAPAAIFSYTLVPGDTLYGVSRRFGVPVSVIFAMNPQALKGVYTSGSRVLLPANAKDLGKDDHALGTGLDRLKSGR